MLKTTNVLQKNLLDYVYDTNYINGGKQIIFKFDNGYGASVVNHDFSYGNEIAVLKFDDKNNWSIDYDTHITSDVLGYLSTDEIFDTLSKIKNL